jgi:hypothetical protein
MVFWGSMILYCPLVIGPERQEKLWEDQKVQ